MPRQADGRSRPACRRWHGRQDGPPRNAAACCQTRFAAQPALCPAVPARVVRDAGRNRGHECFTPSPAASPAESPYRNPPAGKSRCRQAVDSPPGRQTLRQRKWRRPPGDRNHRWVGYAASTVQHLPPALVRRAGRARSRPRLSTALKAAAQPIKPISVRRTVGGSCNSWARAKSSPGAKSPVQLTASRCVTVAAITLASWPRWRAYCSSARRAAAAPSGVASRSYTCMRSAVVALLRGSAPGAKREDCGGSRWRGRTNSEFRCPTGCG